jgi:hypothetical protein
MKKKAYYSRKIKRAAQLLFYKRHRTPGVRGWELKNKLGSDYPKILKVLDDHLEKLDLQVKIAFEGEEPTGEPISRVWLLLSHILFLRKEKLPEMKWKICFVLSSQNGELK